MTVKDVPLELLLLHHKRKRDSVGKHMHSVDSLHVQGCIKLLHMHTLVFNMQYSFLRLNYLLIPNELVIFSQFIT